MNMLIAILVLLLILSILLYKTYKELKKISTILILSSNTNAILQNLNSHCSDVDNKTKLAKLVRDTLVDL